jgi:hypothetical protein
LDTTDLLDEVFKDNKFANSVNQARYKAGEITLRMLREIDKRYVAAQLARAHDEAQTPRELFDKANRIFQSEPSFTEISIFAENGGVSKLRAHTVETQMTYNSWAGDATLKENSQIDREHAVVSLAYCDVFVTSDPKLTKYCEKAKAASKLQLASVVDHDLWIEALRKM